MKSGPVEQSLKGDILHREGGACPDQLWERKDCPYQYYDLLFIEWKFIFHSAFNIIVFCKLLLNLAATAVKTPQFGGGGFVYLARWAQAPIKYSREPLEHTQTSDLPPRCSLQKSLTSTLT